LVRFPDDDLYGIDLFVLYMAVMGMRNKESRLHLADFFYTRARDQLERIAYTGNMDWEDDG